MPPRFISCPSHGIFLGGRSFFLAGKNVVICDFRQKKPSDYGEDLFYLLLAGKKTLKFRPEKAFGNRRKPLPPPPILILPPDLAKLATPQTRLYVSYFLQSQFVS